jgi:hypothetical protein
MRRVATWLVLCVCCALSGAAAAQDYSWFEEDGSSGRSSSSGYQRSRRSSGSQTSEGWGLGLDFAYATPLGDAVENGELSQLTKGVLKPRLDITYGLNDSFVLGVYIAVGGGFQANARAQEACDTDGVSCSIVHVESGLLAEYRILPRSIVNPWLGVNLGLTNLSSKVDSDLANFKTSFLGVGFGASLGGDVQLGAWGFGPFVSFQIGRFMRGKADFGGILGDDGETSGSDSIDKDRRGYHYWLNFGLRARYQFGG